MNNIRLTKQGKLHSRINASYNHVCAVCGGFKNEFTPPDLNSEVDRIVKEIYEGTFTGDIDQQLLSQIVDKLGSAMLEGYGKSLSDIEYGGTDWKMIQNLQSNIYSFSAAKTYQELKTMNMALTDPEGNLISFADFKKIAFQIDTTYNKDWLQTEYNSAIAGGQMAGKWVNFEDDSMLEYVTAGDNRVRESHALLEGVTKPKNDNFWNKYYPPNGWNCRCNVIESLGEATPSSEIQYPHVDPMWQINTAKQGIIFPPDSAYYKGIPRPVMKDVDRKNPYAWIDEGIGKNGGFVWSSNLSDKNGYKTNIEIATILANEGKSIFILPDVSDVMLRKSILPAGIKKNKNPDAMVDGEIFEFKKQDASTLNSIDQNARKALSQADNIIINMNSDTDLEAAKEVLIRRLKRSGAPNSKAFVIYKGKLIKVK